MLRQFFSQNGYFTIFLISLLFFTGCKKDSFDEPANVNQIIDSNFVDVDLATKIANTQAPKDNRPNARSNNALKRVKSTFSVKPDGTNPSMYIVNYENGGFAIIAGDNRIDPILDTPMKTHLLQMQNITPAA
ncbi:Spi family protease inhibitor [Dyadobacter jejuensis]|nr:Spi family protease inhibitor [Dyadobacter jejuensis]